MRYARRGSDGAQHRRDERQNSLNYAVLLFIGYLHAPTPSLGLMTTLSSPAFSALRAAACTRRELT